jgi:enolase
MSGTGVGDEGGFAPPVTSAEEALDLLTKAVSAAGHTSSVRFAVDPASSEFFIDGKYDLDFKDKTHAKQHRVLSSDRMAELYRSLLSKYPIVLLEDPFAEDDWESWTKFMASIDGKIELVGDDLLCTNLERIKTAEDRKACDGLLLKVSHGNALFLCSLWR